VTTALIDTNVLIDVLAEREPFYSDSARVWSLAENGKIVGFVSVISFTNVFYVIRKLKDLRTAKNALLLLRLAFRPVGCDEDILNQAIDAGLKDFEDAIQYVSALESNCDCLITRNQNHFPADEDCPVLTPTEFLAAYSFE
jgi:predicted nucleic acid-binding protein